jgi:hypothetical protein
LESFKRTYGHCGVPPGWPRDSLLADWCTVQRQVHREVRSGYRDATSEEATTITKLKEMDFVWDYEDWHWHVRYEKLRACRGDGAATNGRASPQNVVNWLQEQRRQLRMEENTTLSPARLAKLYKAGVAL